MSLESGAVVVEAADSFPMFHSKFLPAQQESKSWRERHYWVFAPLLGVMDVASFVALYLYFLDLRSGIWSVVPGASGFSWMVLGVCAACIVLFLSAIEGYDLRTEMRSLRFATEYLIAGSAALVTALFLVYAIAGSEFSRSRFALAGAFVCFAPIALILRRLLRASILSSLSQKVILVLGSGAEAEQLLEKARYHQRPESFIVLQSQLVEEDSTQESSVAAGPEWGMLDLKELGPEVQCVVVTAPPETLPVRVLQTLVRVHFYQAPIYTLENFYETHWQKIPLEGLGLSWALQQDFRLARNSSYRVFKRLLDVVAAALGLLLTAPLFLLLPPLIRLESEGPAFFRQTRVGRGERKFTLYKFRTMRNGGNLEPYTSDNDPRVTRLGWVLRKLRLDELPQLWNVLRGDMSLIGPRAEWDQLVEKYESKIPFYHFRHLVKPGITGWAQVNYSYGESLHDTMEKLQYDLYYIKHYSLFLDVSIVLKTLYVMISLKGK